MPISEWNQDSLVWRFAMTDGGPDFYETPGQYAVTTGWRGLCHGVPMDAPYPQATVWGADTAQGELTGYEFIQWPLRGRHILNPRLRQEEPVRVDAHTDTAVADIGELCEQRTAGDALDRHGQVASNSRWLLAFGFLGVGPRLFILLRRCRHPFPQLLNHSAVERVGR
ncbi:hypothetical protein [Rhodococcus opacus]|uniref:hypothetical protein n=1 Tax=Rhodococcus opacus TaxID=37919 RepID=UPI001F53F3A9|nr:hypothetical protein [Rhodococcus opacus]